jgi:hypothetical protein|tara:strand:- start:13910 stop:14038 length:129 start_codon:yes stop_codon:yes gene_type:complete
MKLFIIIALALISVTTATLQSCEEIIEFVESEDYGVVIVIRI